MTFQFDPRFDWLTIALLTVNGAVAAYVVALFVTAVLSWIQAGPSLDKS